ncbi:hypothetical protein SAY87_005918 [Trapa incisa]|uniref:Uncharacterized protein n=1 Tax=Trapa incisa TaxID=236973 RepID=A0AAN7K5J7_9MYRT|nr:hypothetical protein SAY87_005918 [Trapa incisa]
MSVRGGVHGFLPERPWFHPHQEAQLLGFRRCMDVRLRYWNPPPTDRGAGEDAVEEDKDRPQGQPHLLPVREHGGSEEEADRHGDRIREIDGGGRWDPRGPALLPRPGRLHDRDMQLRQPPGGAPRR